MPRFRSVSLFLCAILPLVGCMGGSLKEFPTAKTSGTVTCEGEPVPHVMVFFEPMQSGKSAVVGKQAFAVADADGNFVLSAYGDKDGAVIGKNRIRVGAPHPEDYPGFKCDCVLNSEIDIEVVEIKDGDNTFDVKLKKKAGNEKPTIDDIDREAELR